jgi:hypothetical protein
VQFRAVTHRNNERAVMLAQAVRLHTLGAQVNMISRGGPRRLPYSGRPLSRLGLALQFLCLTLAPNHGQPSAVTRLFLRRQPATNVRTPCIRHSSAPIAKGTGSNSVTVKHVPAGVVAVLTVAWEAMQFAVRLKFIGRLQISAAHCRAKLLERINHGAAP